MTQSPSTKQPTLLEHYRVMVHMREFELACLEGVSTREIHGELHTGIGQEAIGAALAGLLRDDDALASTHRSHLHGLAKGVDPYALMAEIYERTTGLCGGFGGHMHLFDPERKFSTTGIVGAGIPVALGQAYAAVLRGSDAVAVAVTGDGGVNTGAFHEALTMAALWSMPLIILVENNEWAISVPFEESSPTATVAERVAAYGIPGARVDGLDVFAVRRALDSAVTRARAGDGPSLVEATCYRFRGHYEGDPDAYRDAADRQHRREERDPLVLARRHLLESGEVSQIELDTLNADVHQEVAAILARVRQDRMPDPGLARQHVFASSNRVAGAR